MSYRKRILIVDDNPSFIELATGIFSPDYDLETAADGTDGLQKAIASIPDLVILDVNMPGMTGIEFARKLAACRETTHVPIIVITASDYNSLTESLLHNEHNVKVFMTKLSPVEAIREKVLAVINKEIP
jgi:CheY-like chemotaxis protein